MRTFAVAIAVLSFLAGMPTSVAADECANPGSAASFCVPVPIQPTSPVTGVGVPPTPYWGKYYLWIGAGHCLGGPSPQCTTFPTGPGSGIPMPDGSYLAAPHVMSVLFRESNGVAGLQRSTATAGGRAPDATVLL